MFIDILLGLCVTFVISIFSNFNIPFTMFGIFAALSPDIDVIIFSIYRGIKTKKWIPDEFAHVHRDILHHPIPFSIGGGAIWWYMLGWEWGLLWIFASILHFIHDTFEGGFGIRWLSPFGKWGKMYITFAIYCPIHIISDKKAQEQIAKEYGNSNWFKDSVPKFLLKFFPD